MRGKARSVWAWFCNLAEEAFIFIHVLRTCALNGGRCGELGLILETDGRVSPWRGGTQAQIELQVRPRHCRLHVSAAAATRSTHTLYSATLCVETRERC